jgi:transposase-like protein
MGHLATRDNAVQHGLTAKTVLPEVFGAQRLAHHVERFRAEFRPATPSAELLVQELGRHSAALEIAEQAESACLRCGARHTISLVSSTGNGEDGDELLNAAVNTEVIDRLTRYRRAHEKGFYQALNRLLEQQRARTVTAPSHDILLERQCQQVLGARFHHPDFRCPCCGQARGYWLHSRCRWECADCKTQTGLRAGTVFENSPLPLATWARAISLLLQVPDASIDELATATGCRRAQTLRRLSRRIREALESPHGSALLGGLDQMVAWAPETGGR